METRHKVLIIGAGGIGERHLRCFQTTGRTEVGFCELDPTKRATLSQRYNCTGFADLESALAAGPWFAAVICTPAHTHIPIATQCVNTNMHVLIEKPLSTSDEEISVFQDLVNRAEKIARVAYVHRSIPVVQKTREAVLSGIIGTVRHVSVVSGQNYPSFRPDYREIYYAKRESGGGAIQDALTHVVHSVEWIVGPIKRLSCLAAHQVLPGVEVEDTASLICEHENGTLSSFSINQFQHPNESYVFFNGEKGSLQMSIPRQQLGVFLKGDADWTWQSIPHGDRDGMFIEQANHFLNACEGNPDFLSDIASARQTLKVNLAALESSDTQQFIHLS